MKNKKQTLVINLGVNPLLIFNSFTSKTMEIAYDLIDNEELDLTGMIQDSFTSNGVSLIAKREHLGVALVDGDFLQKEESLAIFANDSPFLYISHLVKPDVAKKLVENLIGNQIFMSLLNKEALAIKLRSEAINKSKSLINRSDVVYVDTETTGLDDLSEIIEISIVGADGTVYFDSLIKPVTKSSPEAFSVHGITEEELKDAPTFLEVYEEILSILYDKEVVIYNASYDTRLLWQSGIPYNLESKIKAFISEKNMMNEIHCAKEIYSNFIGDYKEGGNDIKWQKLSHATAYFNLVNQNAHRSLSDCITTMQVVEGMAQSLD